MENGSQLQSQTEFLWLSIRALNRPTSPGNQRRVAVQGLWELMERGLTPRLREEAEHLLRRSGEYDRGRVA